MSQNMIIWYLQMRFIPKPNENQLCNIWIKSENFRVSPQCALTTEGKRGDEKLIKRKLHFSFFTPLYQTSYQIQKHSNNSYLSVNFSSLRFLKGLKEFLKYGKGISIIPIFSLLSVAGKRTEFSLAHVCFSATSKIMMIMVMTMTTTASTLRGQSLRHSST